MKLRKLALYVILVMVGWGVFITGCGEDPQELAVRTLLEQPVFRTEVEVQAYIDSINTLRHYKEEWMATDSNSPLREEDRKRFTGLNFYPVDPEYVFRTRLHTFPDPEIITMATTTGDEREAIRYGYVEFEIAGQTARLYAYKFTVHQGTELEQYLFIPFKDKTSGTETYAGGRYLDVIEEIPGVVLVDLNDAYNPYCVYNERYSCPIPPRENHLDVAIRAGEKDFIN